MSVARMEALWAAQWMEWSDIRDELITRHGVVVARDVTVEQERRAAAENRKLYTYEELCAIAEGRFAEA